MKRIVTMFLLAVLLMAAVNVNAQEEYTMLKHFIRRLTTTDSI